ncbi:MAG: DNA polymerase I, partial [Chloroflexota bacterium]
DEVTPAKLGDKLREHVDQILMGRDLSRIVRDLPVQIDLEAARLAEYDRDTVVRLFREYEFRTLIERLPPMTGESAEQRTEALRSVAESGYVPAARVAGRPDGWGPSRTIARPESGELQLRLDFTAVTGAAGAPTAGASAGDGHATVDGAGDGLAGDLPTALAAAIVDPGRIEVRGPDRIAELEDWIRAQPALGASLVADDPRPRRGTPLALAVAGADGRVVAAEGADAANALRRLVEQAGVPLVGHEVKPILVARFADGDDAATPVAFDTQIAAYILNAALRSQTIADVVAENLDQILPPATDLPATAKAGLEALSAVAVREPLERRLADTSLDRLFREIELPLIPVLARMEAVGVALDRAALAALDEEFRGEIQRLELEIYADVGHEFNLGSPKQLEQVLFFELNLPKGRKTKTGFSTDASVLEELRPAHPMIDKLLEWRIYTKLRSTYVEALPSLISEQDGRLHTTFHQAVASTGRLSSSDPNLQNIPIRTALGRRIRRAFVAGSPELTLLAADYSQIELRILAHVSGDEHLKDAFARQADIHRETAARVLHKDPADVDADERSMAKMVNFGLAYGMSDFGLASRANIPRQEAQDFINSYFAAYSGISYYMMAIKEQAKSQGFVETLLGRKRQIPELRASNPTLRGAGERMAINMPIQGTAADIQKIAMIRTADRVAAEGLRARLLLTVHDELLFEVPRDEVDRLAALVRETMEGALPLSVPLVADVKVGDNWEAMTPLTREDAIAAEADEMPLEAPVAPIAG